MSAELIDTSGVDLKEEIDLSLLGKAGTDDDSQSYIVAIRVMRIEDTTYRMSP